MGGRLRVSVAAAALAAVFALGYPAIAAEYVSCWVTEVVDPVTLDRQQVTRCRIAGGDTVDYANDSSVPGVLSPNVGSDLTGQCWFLTSASTPYVVITRYADGSADIGLLTDPTDPSSIVAIGPTLPRCTSEPIPTPDPAASAWNYVMSYIHPPPTPTLNPAPGQGVTGLPTYVSVPIPTDHSTTLSSGLSSITVEIRVPNVVVRWGDGSVNTYPATETVLSGYPDGSAHHIYENKDDDFDLTVEYDWFARWRTGSGPWITLPVPNTDNTTVYPVAEIVSKLTP